MKWRTPWATNVTNRVSVWSQVFTSRPYRMVLSVSGCFLAYSYSCVCFFTVYWLPGPPYRTPREPPPFPIPCLRVLTLHPTAFPPSACNIHLGECCHDETRILMLTRTLPGALFTASVIYHQIKAASEGWGRMNRPRIFIRYNKLK